MNENNTATTAEAARAAYYAQFSNSYSAAEYENTVLSESRALLPDCALRVLDGGDATAEYWEFLISQIEI